MQIFTEDSSRSAELARELNAVYGLLEFARARCYPPALTAQLHAILQSYLLSPQGIESKDQRLSN